MGQMPLIKTRPITSVDENTRTHDSQEWNNCYGVLQGRLLMRYPNKEAYARVCEKDKAWNRPRCLTAACSN